MFEPKRKHVNFQYLSQKSAPTAYLRFVRFALLIAILCNISPIYQAIVTGGSVAYLVYKLVITALYFVAFVGMIQNKWFGCVFFCGAFALSSLLYAVETVISFVSQAPSTAKLLIIMLLFEVIVFWASCVYFRKRRLLFKPDYPMATPEELQAAAEEAKIAEEEQKTRGNSLFGAAIKNVAAKQAAEKNPTETTPEENNSAESPTEEAVSPQDSPEESNSNSSED